MNLEGFEHSNALLSTQFMELKKKVNATEFDKEKPILKFKKNKVALEISKVYHQIVYFAKSRKLYQYLIVVSKLFYS
jgi:hypothetical protein